MAELLTSSDDWREEFFAPYAEERRERMQRLRTAAIFVTNLYARFDPAAGERRVRARARMREKVEIASLLLAVFAGPEIVPANFLEPDFIEGVFAP